MSNDNVKIIRFKLPNLCLFLILICPETLLKSNKKMFGLLCSACVLLKFLQYNVLLPI